MARVRGLWRARRAQSLVEFALILPVLILLIFGLIDFARVFQAYVTLENAAREAGRYAVTGQRMTSLSLDREESIRKVGHDAIIGLPRRTGSGTPMRTNVSSDTSGFWQIDFSDKDGNDTPGQSGEMVHIRVSYTLEMMTPPIRAIARRTTATPPIAAARVSGITHHPVATVASATPANPPSAARARGRSRA